MWPIVIAKWRSRRQIFYGLMLSFGVMLYKCLSGRYFRL
jgi:hypothetical protein